MGCLRSDIGCRASARNASQHFTAGVRARIVALVFGAGVVGAEAQTQNYFGAGGTITGAVWSTNPAGPYTSAFDATNGGIMNFGNTVTSITGASLTVAGISATANVSGWTAGGTLSNASNGVIDITVASNITLDFGSQGFTGSGTAGYVKKGAGVLALAGNTYGGGFTLNAGTVIMRGVNAMGGSTNNVLTLNGGTVASNASRSMTSAKYGGGIVIGGDVQFGELAANVALANDNANLTFSNDMSLGAASRTLTLGNKGTVTFGGAISGSAGTGLTFMANSGTTGGSFVLSGANTYTGATVVNSGTVKAGVASVAGTSGAFGNNSTVTLANTAGVVLDITGFDTQIGSLSGGGANGGNVSVGAATLTVGGDNTSPAPYGGVISGTGGGLAKVGTGTLILSGSNLYNGATTVSGGNLQVGQNGTGKTGTGAVTVEGAGAVLSGSGTVDGSTTTIVIGTVKPGDSGGAATGMLSTNALSFTPVSSTTVAELQIVSAAAFDVLNITGDLTLNSNSNIYVNGNGYIASVGDTFTIIDWTGVLSEGGFSTGANLRTGANSEGNEGNLDLPDITGIGLWQISGFAGSGDLSLMVVAVPEPTRGVLILTGTSLLMCRRRRAGQ